MKKSLAIAYAMKKKPKKLAFGGGPDSDLDKGQASIDNAFKNTPKSTPAPSADQQEADRQKKYDAIRQNNQKTFADGGSVDSAQDSMRKAFHFSEGGSVQKEMMSGYSDMPQEHEVANKAAEKADDDLVMRIMRKRYSEGGQVANDVGTGQEADKMPNQFDDLVLDDSLESSYDGDNAGDHLGNAQKDEDEKDIVGRIMSSRKKKDRMPNPA